MRKRRTSGISAEVELEMLQTDIMRFMAIIALCLLAIFAMVQSLGVVPDAKRLKPLAGPEPVQVASIGPPEPLRQPATAVLPSKPVPVTPEPAYRPAPEPTPEPPQPMQEPVDGFALKFADDAAFMTLLRRGQLSLQVQRVKQSWRWEGGGFKKGRITGDFYQLEPATVPLTLRQKLTPLAPAAGSQWLVSLPAHTRKQLAQLTSRYRGGILVIDASGSISRKH